MAALIPIRRQPILIPVNRGPALVPNGGVAAPAQAAPLAALADQTGAPAQALVSPGQAMPLADEAALAVALSAGQGGPARGGALIDQPHQPAPMESPDDMGEPALGQNGGFDVLKMLKGMGSAAGAGRGANDNGDSSSGGGMLDKIKALFLGPKTAAPDPTGPVDLNAGLNAAPAPVPVQTGALDSINAPGDTSGALVDAPVPTERPPAPGEGAAFAAQRVAAAQSAPGAGDPGFANSIDPALAHQDLVDQPGGAPDGTMPAMPNVKPEPNILDKLRANPLAMTLIMGGLGTMAAASRRGATPLGSIGEGLSGGLRTAFESDAAQRQRDLDERRQDTTDKREADEEVLRGKQGAFYDARSAEQPALAQASQTRAEAAKTSAGARSRSADAAMIRADAYAKGDGKGGKGASVFQQKQQAWMAVPGHENDLQGALDYAAGHKTMSGSDKYLSARRLATSQLNAMITPPDDPEKFLDDTAGEIMKKMDANDVARGNGQPGNKGAAAPAPAKQGGPALSGPPPARNAGALHNQALAAIKKGAPADAVRQRYKKMTGQNADF